MKERILREDFNGSFVEAKVVFNDFDCVIELFSNVREEKRLTIRLFKTEEDLPERLVSIVFQFFTEWQKPSIQESLFLISKIKDRIYLGLGEKGVSIFEKYSSNSIPFCLNVFNVGITEEIDLLMGLRVENIEKGVGTNGFSYYPDDETRSFEDDLVLSKMIDSLKKGCNEFIELDGNIDDVDDCGVKTTLTALHDRSLIFKMEMLFPSDDGLDFVQVISSIIVDDYIRRRNAKR